MKQRMVNKVHNKMQKRICAMAIFFVMTASVFVCSLSLGISDSYDGLFYAVPLQTSAMSEGNMRETSLAAPIMPGHSISEDYRQEALLKGQHFNLKCITMLFVILAICSCMWFNSYDRSGFTKKVKFRLLI